MSDFQIQREDEIEQELNLEKEELDKAFGQMPGNKNDYSKHIIINDNCGNEKVLEYLQKGNIKPNLIVTSPPYNAGIDYGTGFEDSKPIETYKNEILKPFLEFSNNVLNPGGRIAINLRDIKLGTGSRFPPIVFFYEELSVKRDYIYRGCHIWYKGREESSTAWGSWRNPVNPSIIDLYEYVYIFQKPGEFEKRKNYQIDKDEFIESDIGVWKIRPVKKIFGKDKKNKAKHPCPFPLELPLRVIKLYTYPGDWIIDPFGGISTSSEAALKSGRNSVSIDINEDYCNEGYMRLKGHDMQASNFEVLPVVKIN